MEKDFSKCDMDGDLGHQNAYNSSYTMEIGIARLDHSYLEKHMQCARVVQNPKSPQPPSDRGILCDLSVEEDTLPSGYSNHVYEEIGNVSKEGNCSENFERRRSISDSDDYLDPVTSPKSVSTDDSGPRSPTTPKPNHSPTLMNEYEDLSPVSQDVCTSYTTLTLKLPNQSTVSDDNTEAKEIDIYENCDTYENEVYLPMMISKGQNNQSVTEKETETLFEYQRNDFLLANVKDTSEQKHFAEQQPNEMNIYTNEADVDLIVEVNVKDSYSVRSDQGSVTYLNDDVLYDDNQNADFETKETDNDIDTTDSEIQGEFDLSPLEPMNQIESEIYSNECIVDRGDDMNAYQEENEDDIKDNLSVRSTQGSESYLEDDVSNVTADTTSVCKSDQESDEDIEKSPRMKFREKKQNSELYSKDDHHFSSTNDLDQIPSNLVKRLSQQFSKSMGDLRYVPFPFTTRKTLPKPHKVICV
jgi:hypothetical protein